MLNQVSVLLKRLPLVLHDDILVNTLYGDQPAIIRIRLIAICVLWMDGVSEPTRMKELVRALTVRLCLTVAWTLFTVGADHFNLSLVCTSQSFTPP